MEGGEKMRRKKGKEKEKEKKGKRSGGERQSWVDFPFADSRVSLVCSHFP